MPTEERQQVDGSPLECAECHTLISAHDELYFGWCHACIELQKTRGNKEVINYYGKNKVAHTEN